MSIISARTEFLFSDEKEPHRARTREILRKYPEIRKLIGKKNPFSFLITVAAVGAQLGLAFLAIDQPWYFVVPVAYFIGTMLNHTFIALIHDASHNLIFKTKWLNNLAAIIANAAMFIPSAVSFKKYHMKHHSFQGIYELDADFPSQWEAKAIGNSWYRKVFLVSCLSSYSVGSYCQSKRSRFHGWLGSTKLAGGVCS